MLKSQAQVFADLKKERYALNGDGDEASEMVRARPAERSQRCDLC